MPEGGELTFETDLVRLDEADCRKHAGAVPGSYLRFTLTDTGGGIPPENLERLFEPFKQEVWRRYALRRKDPMPSSRMRRPIFKSREEELRPAPA